MEIKDLHPFVITLVMVGMIVGIGVLIFNGFAVGSAETTVITNESHVWLNNTKNVTLTNGNLTTLTQILNSTDDIVDTSNYTVHLTEGWVTINGNTSACATGDTCYFYYTYTEYDTPTEDAMTNASGALDDITGDWLGIIVIVGCLAIILYLVIRGIGSARV